LQHSYFFPRGFRFIRGITSNQGDLRGSFTSFFFWKEQFPFHLSSWGHRRIFREQNPLQYVNSPLFTSMRVGILTIWIKMSVVENSVVNHFLTLNRFSLCLSSRHQHTHCIFFWLKNSTLGAPTDGAQSSRFVSNSTIGNSASLTNKTLVHLPTA